MKNTLRLIFLSQFFLLFVDVSVVVPKESEFKLHASDIEEEDVIKIFKRKQPSILNKMLLIAGMLSSMHIFFNLDKAISFFFKPKILSECPQLGKLSFFHWKDSDSKLPLQLLNFFQLVCGVIFVESFLRFLLSFYKDFKHCDPLIVVDKQGISYNKGFSDQKTIEWGDVFNIIDREDDKQTKVIKIFRRQSRLKLVLSAAGILVGKATFFKGPAITEKILRFFNVYNFAKKNYDCDGNWKELMLLKVILKVLGGVFAAESGRLFLLQLNKFFKRHDPLVVINKQGITNNNSSYQKIIRWGDVFDIIGITRERSLD